MLRRLNLFYFFLGCIFLTAIYSISITSTKAEESLKFDLDKELKKGNLFIGLKAYLGGKNDTFSINKNITFETYDGFLNLYSSNGIKHKSKQIKILWKDIPIETPYSHKKLVFGPFASYESAQRESKKLENLGLSTTVAYPKNWEIWSPLGENMPSKEFNYKLSKRIYKSKITPFLSTEFTLQKLEGPIYISSDQDIKINNINFGNNFYLAKDAYGTWTLIQKMSFDDYLAGVLPYEIGPNSPLEALKAQAVIARTWAIYNSKRFGIDNYHLCITTQCQVYKPPKNQNEKVKKAIKDTSNLVMSFGNKPINSFYHGSNGGISASASESWEMEDYPYFKVLIDGSKSIQKTFQIPIRHESVLNEFLDTEEKKLYGSNHSLFRWKKRLSNSEISEYLQKNMSIGMKVDIVDLKVVERGASGRVTKLELIVNNSRKPIFLVKDDIRRIFSFLPSNLFTINKLNNNLWQFKGGGFGHGVGLSQSGAIEMAEFGFTYEQILNHYYQGAKLRKIEISSQ